MNALPVIGNALDTEWLIITIIVGVIGVIWFFGGIIVVSFDAEERGKDFLIWVGGGIVGAIILFVLFFPFNPAYWHYDVYKGTVTAVSSRLVSNGSGNGMEQKFVVTLNQGGGKEISLGCLDTRCSLIKIGNALELRCESQFELNGTFGSDCNWGALAQYNSKAKRWERVA